MAQNDFLAFATNGLANVMSQAAYAALAAQTLGFSAGIAPSAQVNKVWRQGNFMAALLAQYMVNQTGSDVLDDGDFAGKLAILTSAITVGSAIKPARVVTTSVNMNLLLTDYRVGFFRTVGVAAFNAQLPTGAQNGQEFVIEDLNKTMNGAPVTVLPPAGDTIAGDANFVMNINKQCARFTRYENGATDVWSVKV